MSARPIRPAALGVSLLALAALVVASAAAALRPAISDAGVTLRRAKPDPALARDGFRLARQYCGRCHGDGGFEGSRDFSVLDPRSLEENGYVVPGDAANSEMWARIENGSMPPKGEPRPGADEAAVLEKWIAAGAPRPGRDGHAFLSTGDMIESILADLRAAREIDRPYLRYFTFAHLANQPERIDDLDVRLYRAALSKALNSLSWEPDIVVPAAVEGSGETVYRVDLRDVGWDAGEWHAILSEYPYGLTFGHMRDEKVAEASRQVWELAGGTLPYVRADWFAVTASRPPLYHSLLEIPSTDAELEKRLNVDVAANFRDGRLARAGFAESGVSVSNRMVERHPAAHKYYWKSYDFAKADGNGNLFRNPLGPAFPGNPYERHAFAHDGGEMIFGLPNGLQGYMLTKADGERLDVGPVQIVRDRLETGLGPEVVNGISCMHCHRHGVLGVTDAVRDGLALEGEPRRAALELYLERSAMDALLDRDRKRFLAGLDEAIGPFLKVGEDADREIETFPEPIGAVARLYHADLDADAAAAELGLKSGEDLAAAARFDRGLQRLGLGPFANGQSLDRSLWESRDGLVSPMQEAARVLRLGTPFVPLR